MYLMSALTHAFWANCTLESFLQACAGLAGEDIGCLMSPNATNVQRITPNISNLHFHANSEHTRDGTVPSPSYTRTAVVVLCRQLQGLAAMTIQQVRKELSIQFSYRLQAQVFRPSAPASAAEIPVVCAVVQ